ncbi:MAG: fibrobacter succinogenes major paralogous domain-containing protein [Fibromonadaceae bacterium]|nr:fibrobacter succinogenes major paralogous domain-containing protein [Fibromonadaceae bacterium]
MNKIKAIAVSLVFFAVMACGGGGGDVSVVKKGKLQACPDFTVEEMFDGFLEKPKWQRTSENGIDYVNVSGITAGSGKPVNVFMQFWVRNDNFGVQAIEINGESGNNADVYIVLNKMCTPLKEKAEAEQAKKEEAERSKRASKGAIQADPIKDTRDGKTYKTVKIGEQIWMAENLNIDIETGNSECYENNEANCKKYGRLYDWETAMDACPKGWHLPSGEEWDKLLHYVDGSTNGTESSYTSKTAGKYLKAKSGWNNNGNGTDNYGFSALSGSNDGRWWSSSEYTWEGDNRSFYAYSRNIGNSESVLSAFASKGSLFSVRCLQN